MPRIRECLKCGVPFEGRGSYCLAHPFGVFAERPRSKVYGSARWKRLRATLIAEHIAVHEWACPGDGPSHPAHPSTRLSIDHIHRLGAGGLAFARSNLRVLCVDRNAARGLARAGVGV